MIHLHEVRDQDTHYKINPLTMEIEDNGSGKNELNLGDHNSEIYTFEIPRVVEGHDMTLCNLVEVHFINIGKTDKSKDVYTIIDMEHAADDADTLVFSWPVSGSATMYSGNLNYRIKFACIDKNGNYTYRKWTGVYKGITVGDGFDNGEGIEQQYSDVLAQWEARISALEENGGGGGAGVFFVDVVVENLGETVQEVLETEFAHIVEAYNNDYSLICRETLDTTFGGNIIYYTLDTVQRNNGDISSFSFTNSESRTSFIIFSDGTLDYRKFNDGVVLSVNGNEPDMNGNVEIATGDSKSIFYVTAIRSFYGESLSVTTDWNDIVGAYISGKTLICKITDEGMGGFLFAHLSSVDSENPTSFTFICEYFEVTIGEDFGMVYERLSNNQIQSSINDLNTDMGNISAALDAIIEIQNQLIGGDGV